MHFSVSCPACHTEFPVDSEKVPPEGVRAICSTCERVFPVERPQEAEDEGWDGAPVTEEPETEAEDEEWDEAPVAEEPETEAEKSEAESAAEFDQFFEPVLSEEDVDPEPGPVEAEAPETATLDQEDQDAEAADDWSSFGDELTLTDEEEAEEVESEPAVDREAPAEEAPAAEAPRFGQRDPEEKAARLARVLVQDMIAYNQDLYQKALERGSLEEDFENEVQKSWEEYVDRIGKEMATSTTYFKDALNEILAKGEEIFDGPP